MSYVRPMLESSPINPPVPEKALDVLAAAIQACFDCAQACTACADACLAESKVNDLVRCIRLNTHCADLCDTTGRLISRQGSPELIRAILQACVLACRLCAEECEKHVQMGMEHCRICAQECRRCEMACREATKVVH